MSMSFTQEQLAEIDLLRNGQGTTSFNYPARPYSGAYNYVLHLISEGGNPNNGPAPGVNPGIWHWFRGATQINRGEGFLSVFIREYTAEQNRIRTGQGVSVGEMNAASDKIGEYVINDIINTQGLISLTSIGDFDAVAMTQVLTKITFAGWSGNLLLPMMGEPKYFTDNILERPDGTSSKDSYNFFALIRSATYALTQALGTPVTDIFDGIRTLGLVAFGDTATLDAEKLKTVTTQAFSFFENIYGDALISPVLLANVPLSFGLTYANSFLFSHVVIGKEGDVRDVLTATHADDLVHGGGGNDTIFASDASLSQNPLFDSDLEPIRKQYFCLFCCGSGEARWLRRRGDARRGSLLLSFHSGP